MKKINLIILLVALFGSAGYVGYLSTMENPAEATPLSAPGLLPDFTLTDINGKSYAIHQLAGDKPTLLIYFNSTCHLCQEELDALSKRIEEFKSYTIILTTVQPVEEMIDFATSLGIKDKSNVHFLLDSRMDVAGYLQIKSVPSIYCYDARRQLVAEYVGITDLDLLKKKLATGT